MSRFRYEAPGVLAAVLHALGSGGRALAGGTDLLREIHAGTTAPELLVSLRHLERLAAIEPRPDGGLTIGARVTLAQLAEDGRLRAGWTALAEAAAGAATPQIRRVATLAGNLLQAPACAYYRNGYDCRLLGGAVCGAREGDNTHHAILGGGLCVSGHPSDAAAALLALDADISWVTADGTGHYAPLADLYRLPDAARPTEIALPAGALVTAVHLPPPNGRSVYLQARERATWAFALIGVAARLVVSDGRVTAAGLALTGAAPIPWRLPEVEAFLVALPALAGEWAADAAHLAVSAARPLADNAYKVRLVEGLVQRALLRLAGPATADPAT